MGAELASMKVTSRSTPSSIRDQPLQVAGGDTNTGLHPDAPLLTLPPTHVPCLLAGLHSLWLNRSRSIIHYQRFKGAAFNSFLPQTFKTAVYG